MDFLHNIFHLLILILLTSNAYAKVGKPSPKYDGVYTYTDFCSGDSQGAYDGSQFIIKDGMVTNDRGGAGRWEINLKKSKIDEKGNVYILGKRKGLKSIIKGKEVEQENIKSSVLR